MGGRNGKNRNNGSEVWDGGAAAAIAELKFEISKTGAEDARLRTNWSSVGVLELVGGAQRCGREGLLTD